MATTVWATPPGGDDYVLSNNAVYATCRTGSSLSVGEDTHYIGQSLGYAIFESCLIFDTSGIPDTDDVSAVVLSLDGILDQSVTNFVITAAYSPYNGGPLVTGDWVSGVILSVLTTYATVNSSSYASGYFALTSAGAAFNSAINKTGNTAMILYSDRHSAGTVPGGDEYIGITSADNAGTTADAKLDITHAAGGGGSPVGLVLASKALHGLTQGRTVY